MPIHLFLKHINRQNKSYPDLPTNEMSLITFILDDEYFENLLFNQIMWKLSIN